MMSIFMGQKFFLQCYDPVGEMMDLMALINSAINFFLYFLMSSEFNSTLKHIIGMKINRTTTNVTITTKIQVRSLIQQMSLMLRLVVFNLMIFVELCRTLSGFLYTIKTCEINLFVKLGQKIRSRY